MIAVAVGSAILSHEAAAKAPGVTHCYKRVCHRVRTILETQALLGRTLIVRTSFYDVPGIDRFNRGTFTSNGERFRATDPGRAASSDLPDGTELLLRHPATGRVSQVRINDFGPFRGNRRLDVTRRVALDLGFTKGGVTDLEVTVIALPRAEDLTYRRNRPRLPAEGALGTFQVEEMPALIARLVAGRTLSEPTAALVAAAETQPSPPAAPEQSIAMSPTEAEPVAEDRAMQNASGDVTVAAVAAAGDEASSVQPREPDVAVVAVADEAVEADVNVIAVFAVEPQPVTAQPSFAEGPAFAGLPIPQGGGAPASSRSALLTLMAALTSFLLWATARLPRNVRHDEDGSFGGAVVARSQSSTATGVTATARERSASPAFAPFDEARRRREAKIELVSISFERSARSPRLSRRPEAAASGRRA